MPVMYRVGIGYDVHKLVGDRKLFLGGVEIPHSLGLEGHSDADALIHAICDALLGAIGEVDIGHFFPNTDDRWKNVRSKVLPGLTGLAQVNGRNNITWEELFEYDKEYVEKLNFWLDVKIFFKTIVKVFKRADIVEQDKTKQNYYYGDYLLETDQIKEDEYNKKIKEANDIIEEQKFS